MPEPFTFLTIAATFIVAGAVKGVIGLGLPTVSLAVLTVAFDLPSAMALLLVPHLRPTSGKRSPARICGR